MRIETKNIERVIPRGNFRLSLIHDRIKLLIIHTAAETMNKFSHQIKEKHSDFENI